MDSILNEMIKHGRYYLLPPLEQLFNDILQSWTKVLGQIYIWGAFSHAPHKLIYTCSAPPPPPPPLLQCWTRVHAISLKFQHCIGGGGGGGEEQRILKFLFKNT